MTLNEILLIMQNRILTLNEARKAAVTAGDLERVTQIESDLLTTLTSIEQMKITIQAMDIVSS